MEKIIVMDIDGTLCPEKSDSQNYEDLRPFTDVVEKLQKYKLDGFYIILFTSRNMRTYNGSLGLINKNTSKVVIEWLERYNIPYDEIYFGKPWQGFGGFYVDDKTIRPDEFLKYSYDEIMDIIKINKDEKSSNNSKC